VLQCLPRKCRTLILNPIIFKKKKKKEKKKMFSERSSRLVGKELDIIFGYISLEL
jgi:hypothetical protein